MEKLRINKDNERYYSEAFIKGWKTGVEAQFNADVREQRPKGEWVDRQEGTFCSECDYKTNEYHNFCPVCGADLRGDKDV